MKFAAIVLFELVFGIALCTRLSPVHADSVLHPVRYAVRFDGSSSYEDSELLQDESGVLFASTNELARWRVSTPPVHPLLFHGFEYYPLASLSKAVIQIDRSRHIIDIAAPVSVRSRFGSYFNYDFNAYSGIVGRAAGLLEYGASIGDGIAAAQVVGVTTGTVRRVFLFKAAWDHYDSVKDQVFRVGDTTSVARYFEAPIRFEGVQWASKNTSAEQLAPGATAYAYEAGWERQDFAQEPMQLGSFMANATLSRGITDRFTAQAHIFADAQMKALGIVGSWRLGEVGTLNAGIAPNTSRAPVEYVQLRADNGRLSTQIDARLNAEAYHWIPAYQSAFVIDNPQFNIGQLITADVGYRLSTTQSIDLSYDDEALEGSVPWHDLSLSYTLPLGSSRLTISAVNSNAFGETTNGIGASLSIPLDLRHTLSLRHDAEPGSPSPVIGFRQDLDWNSIGTRYELNFAPDRSRYADATFAWQSPAFTSRINYARWGSDIILNADVSGGTVFFNGIHRVAHMIDQRNAMDAMRKQRVVTLRFVRDTGAPLEAGSSVRLFGETQELGTVGPNGRTTLRGLGTGYVFLGVDGRGVTCSVSLTVPAILTDALDLGTYVCHVAHK
jgi:outer membrane usher protein FimD/PapC